MRAGITYFGYWILLVFTSWLAMQAVHECGHVLAAWVSGGTVTHVVLHPLAFSRTDVRPNPQPLLVAWAGPLLGAIAPALLVMTLRRRTPQGLRFFAGFCLLANGLYLALGPVDRVGDTGDLLAYGAPLWSVVGVGTALVSAGLFVWHRMVWKHQPKTREFWVLCGVFAALLAFGIVVGS